MKIKEAKSPKNVFIVILILINITSISLLVKTNSPRDKYLFKEKKNNNHDQMIIDKIGLDTIQSAQFLSMKKEHLEELSSYQDQLVNYRKEMFANLNNDSFNIDNYSQKISFIQSEMDKMAFNHFKEMRGICRPDQLQKFDQIMQRIMSRMPRNSKRNKKNKDC